MFKSTFIGNNINYSSGAQWRLNRGCTSGHRWPITILAGLLLCSCWSETFDTVSDNNAVITVRDRDFAFDQTTTFAVLNQVFDLSDLGIFPKSSSALYDSLMLDTTIAQLESRGFERTLDTSGADLVAVVAQVSTDHWVMYGAHRWQGNDYWLGDSVYCTCPSTTYPAEFSTNSIIILLIDRSVADADATELPAVWAAGIRPPENGLDAATIEWAIEKSFAQSPYLTAGVSP